MNLFNYKKTEPKSVMKLGGTVKYLNRTYVISEEDETHISMRPTLSPDVEVFVRKGSPRYCDIFGGTPTNKEIDCTFSRPRLTLVASSSSEVETYGNGFMVKFVDSLCDMGREAAKEALANAMDEPNKNGIIFMLNTILYRSEHHFTSDRIQYILNNLPKDTITPKNYSNELWGEINEHFHELFLEVEDDELTENLEEVFKIIPEEDWKFFKYALAGWESMQLCTSSAVARDIIRKATQQ